MIISIINGYYVMNRGTENENRIFRGILLTKEEIDFIENYLTKRGVELNGN